MQPAPPTKQSLHRIFPARRWTALFLIACTFLLAGGIPARAESENSQQIADRYEQMLVRSPQPGTAFDKVLEWYSGAGGGLEVLRSRWAEAAKDDPSYLLLQGLLAERLRTPDAARGFYREAMTAAADPAPAARLLAALETSEGRFPSAAEAFQKALAEDSLTPIDRMEIMRSLALLYQRSFDDEKAGQVWKDALQRFPDDPFILEEAGEAFLTAGDYPSARSAFEHLQEVSKNDPFRTMAASLRLARTSELEGKTDEAVKTYELALEETSAGSWINREVRARIEELFRRKDDLPGLLAYYERRTTAVPQDFAAFAAQAAVLEDLGRGPESLDKLRTATRLAPEDGKLRLRLIRQLANQGQREEALAEARELAKPADAAPEAILALGDLLWEEPADASRTEAITVWKRLAPADSSDPAKIAMLAELLTSKDQTDEAIAQWKRLIVLTPAAADARQKLAQLFLKKDDKPAAEDTLTGLVTGDLATPENFLALARIQSKLEWAETARATTATALQMFPSDSAILDFAWRQALEEKDADLSARLFPGVWKAASNDFFAEDVVKRYAAFLESANLSKQTLESLAAKAAPDELETSLLLSLAISLKEEGTAATALDTLRTLTTPVRAARASALVAEAFGSTDDQIAALRAIADADPRRAAESLKSVARLQADSGHTEAALKTMEQLIDRTPADGSLYSLYADLAARSGQVDAATRRLQEGVGYAEEPGPLRLQLATFLLSQNRSKEAEKVLQEAFEAEENETRRTEIFRRQIQLAMQTGTIEDLTASLREKQAREQGGARYGTYLAEIFLLQNDFLGAREELAKSLGHNPSNPQAVAKLLDLADRGGDQEEGIRMAARLVELEPSLSNRANLITRLLNSPDPGRGLSEIEKARAEIVQNPSDWSETLLALRKAGMAKQADDIIDEIAASQSTDVLALREIANLRLSQMDIAAAESLLWKILRTGSFPDALNALLNQQVFPPNFMGQPQFFARSQALSLIFSETLNSFQAMFQPNRGGGFRPPRFYYPGQPVPAGQQVTAEQRATVQAFVLLYQLARVQNQEAAFAEKTADLMKNLSVPAECALLTLMNDTEGLKRLMSSQAALETSDLDTDRLLLSTPVSQLPEMKQELEKIQARVAAADPDAAFQMEVGKLIKPAEGRSPEEAQKVLREGIPALLQHPAAIKNPLLLLQLASMAVNSGDAKLSTEILDSLKTSTAQTPPPNAAVFDQQIASIELQILRLRIESDDERAAEMFERLIANPPPNSLRMLPMVGMRSFHSGYGSMPSPLAQNSPDITTGDSGFPFALFQMLVQQRPGSDSKKIRTWFEARAKSGHLDPCSVGLVYADWVAGKKEEALNRAEAIHADEPTPRSAALLLELCEKSKAPAKALEVIDLAELQANETPDVRTFRKIRALRAAGRVPEAKALAESLARGRVTPGVRDALRNELQQLGVPEKSFLNLALSRSGRPSSDRGDQIRQQLSKLVSDNKADEAEKLALTILQNPLPRQDDYQTANMRRNALDFLRSQKRLDALESTLAKRLASDPGDFDAAVRLMEIERMRGERKATDRISEIIAVHPNRIVHLDYAFQLLWNNSDSANTVNKIVSTLICTNPDLLQKFDIRLENLANQSSGENSGIELAETIAGLDDAAFNRLFLPSRLSGYQSEVPFLSQMAEICAMQEKKDTAIALLQRLRPAALTNLDSGLLAFLRLAELQLETGDKAGATATLNELFSVKSPRGRFGMYGGGQSLENMLFGLFMNRISGRSGDDQLERLSKLATETETMDALLASLDEFSPRMTGGISPGLLLRTSLGRENIAAEWRKIALDTSAPLGFFQPQMLNPVLKALAGQKDAAKLIPAFLKRVPSQQSGMGGDFALVAITENLPLLTKFSKDPTVKQFITTLISQATRDPNSAQYFANTSSYPTALASLVDLGYNQEARDLLDFTQSARNRPYPTNNDAALALIDARLNAAEGRDTPFEILCAAEPQVDGSWAGLAAYRFSPEDIEGKWDSFYKSSRKMAAEKNLAGACDELLAAFRLNPRRTADQSDVFKSFESAKRLDDLYKFLSQPALYLPNPLEGNRPAITNEHLITTLAAGALAKNAPASAADWLQAIQSAQLNETLRFQIDSIVLLEKAGRDPSTATAQRVFDLLGFRKDDLAQDRIRNLWSNSNSRIWDLLALLEAPEQVDTARKILSEAALPTSLLAAQRTVDAWLLARTDPVAALKLWQEAISLRSAGENSVSFNEDCDRAMFVRMGATHPTPGDVMAAIRLTATTTRSNPGYQQSRMVGILSALAQSDSAQKDAYAAAWMDAELAGLSMPDYNVSRERLLELAKHMEKAADWDRLAALIAAVEKNPSLGNAAFRDEFTRLRNLIALSQGDYSNARPIAWPMADGKLLAWQWELQPATSQGNRRANPAITISERPVVPEIPNQSGVEILFGEMPDRMELLTKAAGSAASGTLDISALPAPNGFVQAVAVIGDKRVAGPLVPVVAGPRIFPPAKVALKEFLTTDENLHTSQLVSESGSAPDGSPAVKVGFSQQRDRLDFKAPEEPIQSGRTYALRAWMKCPANGSGRLFAELKTPNSYKATVDLTDNYSPQQQWVLSFQALPLLTGHQRTSEDFTTVVARYSNLSPGTDIAGWELLDITDGAYAKWLAEVAQSRESAGNPLDPASVNRMLELAQREPRTVLSIHGNWLVANLCAAAKPEKILPLLQTAFDSKPNPLFANDRISSLFNALQRMADDERLPESLRWDAVQSALSEADQNHTNGNLRFQRKLVDLAKARQAGPEASAKVADELIAKIAAPDHRFFREAFGSRAFNNEQPINDFLPLVAAMADEASLRRVLKEFAAQPEKSWPSHSRDFVLLAIELCIPGTVPDTTWTPRIDRIIDAVNQDSEPSFTYWPLLLADALITQNADPSIVLHLQQKTIDRLLTLRRNPSDRDADYQQEILRTTAALVGNCRKTENRKVVEEIAPRILEKLSRLKGQANSTSLRITLRLLDDLDAMQEKELGASFLKLVEKDVRKKKSQLSAYSKYLTP